MQPNGRAHRFGRQPCRVPARSAEIVAFRPPVRPALERAARPRGTWRSVVLPPLIVLALTLFVWQLLCSEPGARLPPPTKVVSPTPGSSSSIRSTTMAASTRAPSGRSPRAWAASPSASRFAAVVGVALGVLVGQSTWAMRGLDPIFQVLRTVPPLAWLPLSLAGFRDASPRRCS